jgi:glutathione S-transferase
MSGLTLYDFDLDENCYRVRLMLGLLALEAKRVAVDMVPGRDHQKPPLLALNPGGDLPILLDGELVVCGAVAGLAYLARRYGGVDWAPPADAADYASFVSWLEFAAGELPAARAARNASLFGLAGDLDALRAKGRRALRLMEDHMTLRGLDGAVWFVGARASIVDVALFPAFALSRDWGVGHEEFPALRRWLRRFRALPGFAVMPGIPDYF